MRQFVVSSSNVQLMNDLFGEEYKKATLSQEAMENFIEEHLGLLNGWTSKGISYHQSVDDMISRDVALTDCFTDLIAACQSSRVLFVVCRSSRYATHDLLPRSQHHHREAN